MKEKLILAIIALSVIGAANYALFVLFFGLMQKLTNLAFSTDFQFDPLIVGLWIFALLWIFGKLPIKIKEKNNQPYAKRNNQKV